MTVTEWFNQRQGQSLLVPGEPESERGQCVQAADYWLHEGFGLPYHYGNAKDWWLAPGDLLANFIKVNDNSIKAGDFVIYNGNLPGSEGYGHIDVALSDGTKNSYVGADSNWGGSLKLRQVNHSGSENQYILGSLRKKGDDVLSAEGVTLCYQFMVFRNPNQQELEAGIGKQWHDLETAIDQTPERKKIVGKVTDYDHLYKTATDAQNQAAELQKQIDQMGNPTQLKQGIYKV